MPIVINGQRYESWDDVPATLRDALDSALHDGVPSRFSYQPEQIQTQGQLSSTATPAPIQLQRSVFGRLFAGTPIQMMLTLLLIALPIGFTQADTRDAQPGRVVFAIAVIALVLILWLFGLTAYAKADDNGISWRAFVPRQFDWADVESIALVRARWSYYSNRAVLVVRAKGRKRTVWPASAALPNNVDFTDQLSAIAARHGIHTDS